MIRIFRYLKIKDWWQIMVSLVFIISQVWLDLKLPDYMAAVTRLVQTPGSSLADIWRQGGLMLLCALGSFAAAVIVGFLAARVAASFSLNLRSRLFSQVNSFSMAEINRFSTASLITRSTNDITQIQLLVTMGLQLIVKAPIMAVWAVTKIIGKGYQWTVITAGAVMVLSLFLLAAMILVMPKFRQMQILTDNINKVTRENLTGIRVIRAYNAESFREGVFEGANDALTATQLFTSRGMAFLMPLMNLVMSGLSLAIYWAGAYMVDSASGMDRIGVFSNMVVFSSYAMQVVMSFMMFAMMFVMLPRASVSAKRINEVLETRPGLQFGTKESGREGLYGQVEFKGVCFKYPDAQECVLQDINFTVKEGETIAFIGSTGSGKSTLINLVTRFYDATEGVILLDGIDIRDYSAAALYNKIGYVPQKSVIFKGSIHSNVAYGDNGREDATAAEVKRAVAIAQGADFVEALPEQYDAPIAQGGLNLSGGQRQRIAIARAVNRKPEIYIFDDSFSALDYKTDRELRQALKKETAGVTSLIVAQRIGTIMDADQIIVLDDGRQVGQGTHRELLETCPVYREIAASQLSEKELVS